MVYKSPGPATIYTYSPGLCLMPTGRLIATLDLGGPGAKGLPGPKGERLGKVNQCKVFTSDDRGATWIHRADLAMLHATPFLVGEALYPLGHAGDIAIARSEDGGETWSEPAMVIDGDDLHVLSRSGDHRAKSAHDGNIITFHTVRNFRDLVY